MTPSERKFPIIEPATRGWWARLRCKMVGHRWAYGFWDDGCPCLRCGARLRIVTHEELDAELRRDFDLVSGLGAVSQEEKVERSGTAKE
jgi:hypothetical protein